MNRLVGKTIFFISLLFISASIFILDYILDETILERSFHTAAMFTIIYLMIKVILEEFFASRLKDYRFRYNTRKMLSIIFILISIGGLITIWIENTSALVVAYGLLAAGIAISLQDFFKGFTGGILILVNNIYRVGDRIQIGNTMGDIIDIGIFYTTLLETRGWVSGDQATGRLVTVSNSRVLSENIFNYTKDHSFLWDEIKISLTFDSNWESVIEPIINILKNETSDMTEIASKEVERIGEKYYLPRRDVHPMVYVNFDDAWINIYARFVTEAKKRRGISNNIQQAILKDLLSRKDIKISQAQLESWKIGEGP